MGASCRKKTVAGVRKARVENFHDFATRRGKHHIGQGCAVRRDDPFGPGKGGSGGADAEPTGIQRFESFFCQSF